MNDRQIIALLQKRDESALRELTAQHGKACTRLAKRILGNPEDAEEIWNDALLQIWNAIPPVEPKNLAAYVHTLVRNLALSRLEARNAKKRGGGETAVSLEALPEHRQPAQHNIDDIIDAHLLEDAVNRFLATLPEDAATVFVAHYGNHRSLKEIAETFGISYGSAAMSLMRARKRLRKFLDEEGRL